VRRGCVRGEWCEERVCKKRYLPEFGSNFQTRSGGRISQDDQYMKCSAVQCSAVRTGSHIGQGHYFFGCSAVQCSVLSKARIQPLLGIYAPPCSAVQFSAVKLSAGSPPTVTAATAVTTGRRLPFRLLCRHGGRLQHCNTAMLQHCNAATLQHCNTATV
jgi:hypothetical protein